MTPDFKYFHWGLLDTETSKSPLFALYDHFDNHLMIQSDDYGILFQLKQLIKSKTMLDLIEITRPSKANNIDNSVIENWGLTKSIDLFSADITSRSMINNDPAEYAKTMIRNPSLSEVDSKFDDFKLDLQKQIFFIYHCLYIIKQQGYSFIENGADGVISVLQDAVGISENYKDLLDKLLDIQHITDKTLFHNMIIFLNLAELFYE